MGYEIAHVRSHMRRVLRKNAYWTCLLLTPVLYYWLHNPGCRSNWRKAVCLYWATTPCQSHEHQIQHTLPGFHPCTVRYQPKSPITMNHHASSAHYRVCVHLRTDDSSYSLTVIMPTIQVHIIYISIQFTINYFSNMHLCEKVIGFFYASCLPCI